MSTLPGPGDIIQMRASGLSELFDDALRWKAKVLDKRRMPTLGRSHLGTCVHYGTGHYDNERTLEDGNPDIEVAIDKYLEMFNDDAEVHWVDIAKNKAKDIGVKLVADYCQEISPEFEWVKIETQCEPLTLTMPNGLIFEITGTVDRVYTLDGRFGMADLKTGYGIIGKDGAIDSAKHGVQLAVYELLEIMASGLLDKDLTQPAVVIGLSTSSGEVAWEPIENPRTLLFGDDANMGYLQAASELIARGLFVGNPRSMMCTERYCPIYNECFYRRGQTNGIQ